MTTKKKAARAKKTVPAKKAAPGIRQSVEEPEVIATPQAGDKTPGRAAWLRRNRPEEFAQLSPIIQNLADAQ